MPQQGFLFSGSIKENLDPTGSFDYDYIEHILGQANSNINIDLPDSFEIEKGGTNLSNGEKQILNFRRILLKNNDIICLDEATSNLDPITG